MTKPYRTIGLLCGLTFLTSIQAQGQAPAAPSAAKPSLTVTVTIPQTASLTQKISANGNLAAWQEAVIGAEAHGLKITEVRVNVGDRVQRGDVLALLQSVCGLAALQGWRSATARNVRNVTTGVSTTNRLASHPGTSPAGAACNW